MSFLNGGMDHVQETDGDRHVAAFLAMTLFVLLIVWGSDGFGGAFFAEDGVVDQKT